ncbi:MAG: hypothetical protein A2V78_00230 [Betaproteobacteria bacterium RBG_16_64_18]|nr:MAG: hypothetical protein A2V78_00230 [Betaproteobacteria bacterium RBG_16_64_18]OGA13998.1 MAG: hypothetical protein A3H33_11110 [Betaproteobacteria bacterium RIFCSPLOWO2_02_FULL_65_20]
MDEPSGALTNLSGAAKAAPDMRKRLIGHGLVPVGSTPEQFAARVGSEINKWAGIVKRSGAHID